MSYKLPYGNLSPSQLNAWERCQVQYRIFTVEGAKAPPDCALEVKSQTHETLLEGDLAAKIKDGKNLPDSQLQEMFLAGLEQRVPMMKEDPNREEDPQKIVEQESAYFGKIITFTGPWRREVKPQAVEHSVEGLIGDVPVKGRIDLIADEGVNYRIEDLKRQGRAPSKGSAQNSRQLASYAILTNIADVGLRAIVENVTPKMADDLGQISQGLAERTAVQYQGIAGEITDATEKDRWVPVDTTDQRKSWVCTAQYCGAWRIGSKDFRTGRDIACPYGERAQKKVFGS